MVSGLKILRSHLVFAFLSVFTFCLAGSPSQKVEALPQSAIESAQGLLSFIRSNIVTAQGKQLDAFVAHSNSTIALAAGWERVRRTLPLKIPQGLHLLDKAVVARFLGLVEGRIQMPIPDLWCASVKEAQYSNSQIKGCPTVLFPMGQGLSPHIDKILGAIRKEIRLQREGDRWIVSTGSVVLSLPAEGDRVEWAAVKVSGDTAFVALYSSRFTPYNLYAVEVVGSKVLWSTQVWAEGGFAMNFSGVGEHAVEMVVSGGKVAVFGISGLAYLEVFDAKTGLNQCRFNSSLFERKV